MRPRPTLSPPAPPPPPTTAAAFESALLRLRAGTGACTGGPRRFTGARAHQPVMRALHPCRERCGKASAAFSLSVALLSSSCYLSLFSLCRRYLSESLMSSPLPPVLQLSRSSLLPACLCSLARSCSRPLLNIIAICCALPIIALYCACIEAHLYRLQAACLYKS